MIAGLPKTPSRYNPVNRPERALIRRDWILGRMLSLNLIDQSAYDEAINTLITASTYRPELDFEAPWVAEAARFELGATLLASPSTPRALTSLFRSTRRSKPLLKKP